MILIGVALGTEDLTADVSVFRKRFKHLKHHYQVLEIIHCLREEAPNRIQNILRNKSLPKLKRLYSQDRRPRRTVRERPWVLFHSVFPEKDIVSRLKHPDVAFKRFRITGGTVENVPWAGDRPDFTVGMTDLVKHLRTVIEEARLVIMDDNPETEMFRQGIRSRAETATKDCDGRIISLALPVWFRETIPYRRTYRV